ncbi:MAG: hypothetical protein QOF11_2740 [Chloroflexota bacterium]|nr:hypothetical protein [Chloroflexota bacterium]
MGRSGNWRVDEPGPVSAPMLVGGDLTNDYVHLIGPIPRAMVAVGFKNILKGKATRARTEAAQGSLRRPQGPLSY